MSPEKATGSQETAPLADRSQEISAAQSQSSCSALPAPHPSPEASSGEGRPWLLHFLSHCLPDNGQSSTESDQGLTTPQTQIRAKGGGEAVGKEAVSKASWPETEEGGGGGKKNKDVLGPAGPHHPMLDTGPNTHSKSSRSSALVNQRLSRAQHHA